MDLRELGWKSPWEKRTYLLCILFYLSLLLQKHVTVADAGYREELKDENKDSSKLDSLSNFLPYDSKEDSHYKRASAFFPLRGKKSSGEETTEDHQLYPSDDAEDKRSRQFFPLRGKKVPDDLKRASYFMPMRGRKDDGWIDEDYDITDENPYKRASSFMPMRGKKKFEAISDYLSKAGTYSNDVKNPSDSDSYQSSADKRLHSFVPVRGKRSLKDTEHPSSSDSSKKASDDGELLDHSAVKRAVSFMPMRGRRDFGKFEAEFPGKTVTSLLDKKQYSFMPMRGRRDYDYDYNELSEDFDKKANFMPMRGRKNDVDQSFEDESSFKRASSFMPMRGRRTQLRDVVHESPFTQEMDAKLIENKRASSFMPMRGRRSISEDSGSSESNSDVSSFSLTRVRRSTDNLESEAPNSDKRMSFMPMRGRRLVTDEDDIKFEPWHADQLMSLLDKKSSAFMPMRGRRQVDENFTIEPWQADQLMSLLNKKSYSFMPMRGRRFDGGNFTVEPWQVDQLMSLFNKKSSFMPMRGRRLVDAEGNVTVEPWSADQLMSLLNKKSSFMPMRGRRDHLDNLFQDSDEVEYDENDKRSSYFMPMRGRRLESKEMRFYNPYPYLMAGIGSSLMSKPYSDLGVPFNSVRSDSERRKKLRINWDAVKRAFHATRGKRMNEIGNFIQSLKDSGANEAEEMNSDTTDESVLQTRSKRSIIGPGVAMQPSRQYIALKRPMSFFATRGKRLDDSTVDKISKLH